MRIKLNNNLKDIQKYYKKRISNLNKDDSKSLKLEYNEWVDGSYVETKEIWTLPDLTRSERLANFCRSIKKKIV